MKLILLLLRASWRIVLLASLVGAVSGVASMALMAWMFRALQRPGESSSLGVWLFAALCGVVFLTRIASQVLLARLTQNTVSRLRMGLCERILASSLRHLEEIGVHRMLSALTNDVAAVTNVMNVVPSLVVSFVVLVCGAVYLGYLSLGLLGGAAVFALFGIVVYVYFAKFARGYMRRGWQAQEQLFQAIRELLGGVKELKTHGERRRAFLDRVLRPAEATVRENKFLGDCLHNAAIALSRLMFFVALGMLVFAWPRIQTVDGPTLTLYAMVFMFLMSPLDQIMGALPSMKWAALAVGRIEQLGLMLHQVAAEQTVAQPLAPWQTIELVGVTHAYRREGREHGFVLGPIHATIRPGEILFIVGGNGSGKTTLVKLLTGLYVPEQGEVRLDGQPVTDENRESYRQLFSVVFDDAAVFASLWGLESADLDRRAGEYLRELELDHIVRVDHGKFSTTNLSRGQHKRLALLTAYLEDRPVYVFDEWAADQDPSFRKVFYLRILPELKRRGKAVVAVTHDDRYFHVADRIVKLEEGKVVDSFVPERLSDGTVDPRLRGIVGAAAEVPFHPAVAREEPISSVEKA